MNARIKNAPYYRANISHRAAVKTIVEISTVLNRPYDFPKMYDSEWLFDRKFDGSVYSMIDEIKRLQHYADKYFELKKVIKKLME